MPYGVLGCSIRASTSSRTCDGRKSRRRRGFQGYPTRLRLTVHWRTAGHEPYDHTELTFRFCRAAGLSDEAVRSMKMPPAWWARSLYYYHTVATEPVGVVLAMQSTQEGQMPGLIGEVLLPAFEKHYGIKRDAPEIEFFTEHDSADVEHSRRQSDLCAKYLNTPELEARALRVAQEICELRWASISELYRSEVLGEKELLPPDIEC
jgi:pyrroloquinoline quinone (PQQ) biosynthesis protein C